MPGARSPSEAMAAADAQAEALARGVERLATERDVALRELEGERLENARLRERVAQLEADLSRRARGVPR